MKTAVTVLQEMMIKLGLCPEYECIAQSGPQHLATFEYRCSAHGHTVTATARSKKEAKQEAARLLLLRLAEHGLPVPAPFCRSTAPPPTGMAAVGAVSEAAGGTAARSYVALLSELCEEYRLPAPQYELTADTGPPHARHFTMSARLGLHERRATSTTKKSARQLAAEQLYTYLRENLSRLTKDFIEEEALARAHERAMERYVERREELGWRPHLGQRIADYHLGLLTHVEAGKREAALAVLEAAEAAEAGGERVEALREVARELGLGLELHQLPAEGGQLALVSLAPTAPPLALAGAEPEAAAAAALRYLRRALAPDRR
ncbi:Interferon-inducible double stranded RNA-dependent protein kinase activator A-like A [Papilio machaon]|uniref:Interferon-inducible double stranded RNA-dependent protein kinase activator A-like A n=1 Tax=Papilio machaon TaxID=76193 RepID=A0A194RFL9_PAPMA|nr:Interferon-inducible double stranded RNA-dependent protein kinase activator A-like A [Papilio machaon]